jgi:adenosylcobinamide-phosphate synthase
MAPLGLPAAGAVVVAFLVDHFFGEPPPKLHPVVWIGQLLSATSAPWEDSRRASAFLHGAVIWLVGATLSASVAWAAVIAIRQMTGDHSLKADLIEAVLVGVLLKPLLAWRMLHDEVAGVERALDMGLEAGRTQLKRLVSRATETLSASEVRESALESLAENLNDSLVAPLFWFSLGGLPAAAVYRFANTADAMWGYRGRWEWAGKWAARADDALSYLPARLTAALLALAAWRSPQQLSQIARLTPSPNGGWPMGMLALALHVRLGKPGVYVLNSPADAPSPAQFWRGLRLCRRVAWLTVVSSATAILIARRWH